MSNDWPLIVICGGCQQSFDTDFVELQAVVPNGELFCEDCLPEAELQYEEYLEYLAEQD